LKKADTVPPIVSPLPLPKGVGVISPKSVNRVNVELGSLNFLVLHWILLHVKNVPE